MTTAPIIGLPWTLPPYERADRLADALDELSAIYDAWVYERLG